MGLYLLVVLLNKEMFLDIDVVGEDGETMKMSDLGSFEELMEAIQNYEENREVVSKIQEHWYDDAIEHVELNEIKLGGLVHVLSPCLQEPFKSDMFQLAGLLHGKGQAEFIGYGGEHIPEFLGMLRESTSLEEVKESSYHSWNIGYLIGEIEKALENGFSDYMFLWGN